MPLASIGNPGSENPDALRVARGQIRRSMRKRRRAVQGPTASAFARRIAARLILSGYLERASHVGVYLSNDGEASLSPLITFLRNAGKSVYLPCLNGEKLQFRRFGDGQTLVKNRFGIAEPDPLRQPERAARELDLVLMPLVSFDASGNRLGMGGGFYDKTFAFISNRTARHLSWRCPRLVGIAYECQRHQALPAQYWDIPLFAIATERTVHRCPSIGASSDSGQASAL